MRRLTIVFAAAAIAASAGAALAQSAGQNRFNGPETPANLRATTGASGNGAQSAHQNGVNGPETPANIRPGSPSKKLPESKKQ